MTDPTLLIVPGAWHNPDHFRLLVEEMRGSSVRTVALTSSGDDPAVLRDMYADAEMIAAAAAAIDSPVVVLAHSYGGIPTTQALTGLTNVRRLIYLAAFQLDAGESLFFLNGGKPMAWSKVHEREGVGRFLEATTPGDTFYNDVDPVTVGRAVSQLGYFSYAAGRQQLTEVAWRTVPSTYIVCEADNALPPPVQELLAQRAQKVQRLNTSHSPFLSRPAALAELVKHELASA